MKNKKGFTLIELLGVITILGIIMVIATGSVLKIIENSKIKAKYIAAKEITEIAAAYMETESTRYGDNCVWVKSMINNKYLEEDVTNPETGENGGQFMTHEACKEDASILQNGYEISSNEYSFDGYKYRISVGPVGDVTGDGIVDSSDYDRVMQHVAGTNPLTEPEADFNSDGKINEDDANLILANPYTP